MLTNKLASFCFFSAPYFASFYFSFLVMFYFCLSFCVRVSPSSAKLVSNVKDSIKLKKCKLTQGPVACTSSSNNQTSFNYPRSPSRIPRLSRSVSSSAEQSTESVGSSVTITTPSSHVTNKSMSLDSPPWAQ